MGFKTKFAAFFFILNLLPFPAIGQQFCSTVFSMPPESSNIGFLYEPEVKKDRNFKVPAIENHFTFPDQNLRLVTRYTGTLYRELNSALSNNEGLRDTKYLRIMDRMNSALSVVPWHEGTTFSGAAMKKDSFKAMHLKAGEAFKFGYYFSTTTHKNVADGFIKRGLENDSKDRIPVLFIVQGKNGRNVTEYSFYDEAEILFRPDTQFLVTGVKPLLVDGRKGVTVSIEEIYRPLPKLESMPKNFTEPENAMAQRLFDKADWSKALKQRPRDPWNYYGKEVYENWKSADVYLKSLPPETPLTWDLFERVHAIALKAERYKGLQRRMVRRQFREKKITGEVALLLLQKIENGEMVIKIPKVPTRDKTKDSFTHSGDQLAADQKRYFSKDELEMFQRNPFFSVTQGSIRKIDENVYFAEIQYIHPEYVKKVLKVVIEEGNAMLDGARTQEEVLWATLKLQHALLSIHPFSDGNGRTIRLVMDWMLRKNGLATPLWPITNELNLTMEQFYTATVESMNASVKLLTITKAP